VPMKRITGCKSNLTGGLASKLVIGVNARVMLLKNICTEDGRVNGKCGFVTKFGRTNGEITAVYVRFDGDDADTEILRQPTDFSYQGKIVTRKMFPLILSFSSTFHKSQGKTISHVMVDLANGMSRSPGMAYTGLSRVRSLEDVDIIAFNVEGIHCDVHSVRWYNRIRALKGLPPITRYNQKDVPTSGRTRLPGGVPKKRGKTYNNVTYTIPVPKTKVKPPKRKRKDSKIDDGMPPVKMPAPTVPKVSEENDWIVPGEAVKDVLRLSNDGVNCYSNSTVQCLLSLDTVRQMISNLPTARLNRRAKAIVTEMNRLRVEFERTDERPAESDRDSSKLRRSVGGIFAHHRQQSALEFWYTLMDEMPSIDELFRFVKISVTRCGVCLAHIAHDNMFVGYHEAVRPEEPFTIGQILPQELIRDQGEVLCPNCEGAHIKPMRSEYSYQTVPGQQYVLFHLSPFAGQDGMEGQVNIRRIHSPLIDFDVNDVHRLPMFDNEPFVLDAYIEHRGPSFNAGHFTANYRHPTHGWLHLDCLKPTSAIRRLQFSMDDAVIFIFRRLT